MSHSSHSTEMTLAALEVPLDPTLLPAGILLITGLFMLLGGRRLLKPGLGIIGALAGCLAGNALGLAFSASLPAVVWAILGSIIGCIFGLLLWRMTVATLMAASCSAGAVLAVLLAINSGMIDLAPESTIEDEAAPLAAMTIRSIGSEEEPVLADDSLESALTDAAVGHAMNSMQGGVATARERAGNWLGTLNERLGGSLTGLASDWHGLEPRLRSALVGVAALGGLFGFLFGLAAWRQSSAIVTVVAGAGLVLTGSLICYRSFTGGDSNLLTEFKPGIWLGVWIGLALLGGVVQWWIERRNAEPETQGEP